MAFKMKGFTPFTKKADGWRPHHTAETEVSSIEKKQKRLDKRASKGKDVSGAQERLDKRSERVYDREIARAERKERKAAKKLEKGKGKQAARKQYKADKIREAVSPLTKKESARFMSLEELRNSDAFKRAVKAKEKFTSTFWSEDADGKKFVSTYNWSPNRS